MTTHDHEIDEANQSQEPPWEDAPASPQEEVEAAAKEVEEAEPLQITLQSAAEFLGQAQEPELAAKIDAMIETIQATSGADDRKMLRAYALLLRSIGTSMPWDEDEGLDARRFHMESKTALPSWRQCIGACLQLEFSKPDNPDEVTVETVDDVGVIEDAQAEAIEAEEAAEAAKVDDDFAE